MAKEIKITGTITVGDLAEKLDLPPTTLIGELFKNGMMVTINERIDGDTAQIIIDELADVDATIVQIEPDDDAVVKRQKSSTEPGAVDRPPVIAVMGHVDHGKTSLLDYIRQEKVADGESGGITQHISAYQIEHGDKKRKLTFLDTPGHEAFAALREHGAYLTDLVVIVIAADDGIKPQTLEAIRFARKAGVKMIIAANKMDKEGANLDRLKAQLSENQLIPEDYGGDVSVMPVSAITGKGVNELIDMILLTTDLEELKAVPDGPSKGLVIESHMETGKGPQATVLVENGDLSVGDYLVAGDSYGKVRSLENASGKRVKNAGPSTPVQVSGFKTLPDFGTPFVEVNSEKEARLMAEEAGDNADARGNLSGASDVDLLKAMSRKSKLQELNVIVRGDAQGSVTSVVDSLKTLNTDEVAIKVIASGVRSFTENDIYMGASSDAILYGFHVSLPSGLRQIASRDNVKVRVYEVIYELLDDAKEELSERLAPEVITEELGRLKILKVFKTTQKDIIAGGEVTKGTAKVPSKVKVMRDGEELAEVEAFRLQRGPQEVKEVQKGEECGVSLKTEARLNLQEGDLLEFFTRELKERSLK